MRPCYIQTSNCIKIPQQPSTAGTAVFIDFGVINVSTFPCKNQKLPCITNPPRYCIRALMVWPNFVAETQKCSYVARISYPSLTYPLRNGSWNKRHALSALLLALADMIILLKQSRFPSMYAYLRRLNISGSLCCQDQCRVSLACLRAAVTM